MLQCCFCFMFWFFGHKACGILAPQPGIKPTPPALEGKVLTTGPPGKVFAIVFNVGHIPLNSYYDLLTGLNLQFEKHATVESSGQSVESKRLGALDLEVWGSIMKTVLYFKTLPHRQWGLIYVPVSFSFNFMSSWGGYLAFSHKVHLPVPLLSVSQFIVIHSFAHLHTECKILFCFVFLLWKMMSCWSAQQISEMGSF